MGIKASSNFKVVTSLSLFGFPVTNTSDFLDIFVIINFAFPLFFAKVQCRSADQQNRRPYNVGQP